MSLTFDFGDFERIAARLDAAADQIPFALAGALNDAADVARRELIEETWPAHVEVRNARFLRAALTTKGTRATKRDLRVMLYDQLGRGGLTMHEDGGVKRPRGDALAVPSQDLKAQRTSKGVPAGMRPKNLPTKGPSGVFKKGDVLYQRKGTGKNRGLKLIYTLKPSARVPGTVPFHADFDRIMRREVVRAFGPRLQAAMQSRRRR